MADEDSAKPVDPKSRIYPSIQKSGFPFQTAIRSRIESEYSWRILASEFPWIDRQGGDQFLDIVAKERDVFLAIECKKSWPRNKNEQDTLTFLCPKDRDRSAGTLETSIVVGHYGGNPTSYRLFPVCVDLKPSCAEAEFCVRGGASGNRNNPRLLEHDARLLVNGSDAYARHVRATFDKNDPNPQYHVPVLITNSPIFLAHYEPRTVSLTSGEVNYDSLSSEEVPYVRFKKSFSALDPPESSERSVFVVNSESLDDFLAKVGPSGGAFGTREQEQAYRGPILT